MSAAKIHDFVDTRPEIRPGQLWIWRLAVGDGTYFFEQVTEERRINYALAGIIPIKRGDNFIIVSTDDDGPAQPPNVPAVKRWHVALLHGTLVWIDHDSFYSAKLIAE